MRLSQRLSSVTRGLSVIFRRAKREFVSSQNHDESVSVQANSADVIASEHLLLIEEFHRRAQNLGFEDIKNYWWYHTIDLGNGLITPGCYDYRESVPAFKFPDVKGMNVLEIGSATGFFAFEFEKMGAHVTSVELPSVADFDLFPGESLEQCLKKFEIGMKSTELLPSPAHGTLDRPAAHDQYYHYFVDGPFKFCHRVLSSKVRRCYSTIYDVSKENLGREDFDVVFLGDVLLHTVYPLKALAAAAALCRGTLIIAQDSGPGDSPPMMGYIGGDKIGQDTGAWWLPNLSCFEQMLKKLGFREVRMVGTHSGYVRPTAERYERAIIHATR